MKKNASKNVFKTHKETKKTRTGWIKAESHREAKKKSFLLETLVNVQTTPEQLHVSFSQSSIEELFVTAAKAKASVFFLF